MSQISYGFDGACRPGGPGEFKYGPQETFSIGIFKILPKASGRGTKRGPVEIRIKGLMSDPEAVYEKAHEIVDLLNKGKYTGPKTVKVFDT